MSCKFAHDDGAYVLGALAPSERVEYERHLATCAECSRAVQMLAGLPGLLSRIDPEVLESPPDAGPVPDTLLPSLVHEVRRTQRRRTWVSVGVAAAALLTVAAGSVAVTSAIDGNGSETAAPPTASAPPAGQEMHSVAGADWMTADLSMTGVAWGTKLDLTCSYKEWPSDWGPATEPVYVMVVETRDGETEQVATWRGLPGKTMRLATATATSRDDIASVEVRTADGTRVLELTA